MKAKFGGKGWRRFVPLIVVCLVLAAAGVMVLRGSFALTPTASLEPENGSLTANASQVSDASASNGKAILFSQPSSATVPAIAIGYDPDAYSNPSSYFSRVAAAGAEWVRIDLYWNDYSEPSKGTYVWGATDAMVNAAKANGLEVLFVIQQSPHWARANNCFSKSCPPASASDYGDFVRAAVSHYKSQVKVWEIWNEPNIYQFWNMFYGRSVSQDESGFPNPGGNVYQSEKANPVKYTALLKDAYAKAKQADPSATILAAGLSATDTWQANVGHVDFVNAMYDNGARGYFDAIAYHPYCYSACNSADWKTSAGWRDVTTLYGIMQAEGDGAKKIWITEFGAPTPTSGGGSGEMVTEAKQAQLVTESYAAIKTMPWVDKLFWYRLTDSCSDLGNKECWFGLVRANGTQKPAYTNFRNL